MNLLKIIIRHNDENEEKEIYLEEKLTIPEFKEVLKKIVKDYNTKGITVGNPGIHINDSKIQEKTLKDFLRESKLNPGEKRFPPVNITSAYLAASK
jgi:hypothetical protein